jgi:hypothetical protein
MAEYRRVAPECSNLLPGRARPDLLLEGERVAAVGKPEFIREYRVENGQSDPVLERMM